jgi:hypothetical protein
MEIKFVELNKNTCNLCHSTCGVGMSVVGVGRMGIVICVKCLLLISDKIEILNELNKSSEIEEGR